MTGTILEAEDQDTDAAMDFLDQALTGDAPASEIIEQHQPAQQVQQNEPLRLHQAPAPTIVQPTPHAAEEVIPAEPEPEAPTRSGLPPRFYTKNLPEQTKVMLEVTLANPTATPTELLKLTNQRLGLVDEQGEPTPVAQETPDLDRVTSRLQEVQAKLKEAAEDEGIGSVFNFELLQLTQEQAELVAQKMLLQRDQRVQHTQEIQQAQTQEQQAIETALQIYPDLQNEASELNQIAVSRMEEINAIERAAEANPAIANDPDVQLALAKRRHPDFALLIAREVATELGISPTQAQAKPGQGNTPPNSKGQPTPPNPKPQAQPGPLVFGGNVQQAHRVTIQDVTPEAAMNARFAQAAQSDSLDDIDSVLGDFLGGGAAASQSQFVR